MAISRDGDIFAAGPPATPATAPLKTSAAVLPPMGKSSLYCFYPYLGASELVRTTDSRGSHTFPALASSHNGQLSFLLPHSILFSLVLYKGADQDLSFTRSQVAGNMAG